MLGVDCGGAQRVCELNVTVIMAAIIPLKSSILKLYMKRNIKNWRITTIIQREQFLSSTKGCDDKKAGFPIYINQTLLSSFKQGSPCLKREPKLAIKEGNSKFCSCLVATSQKDGRK